MCKNKFIHQAQYEKSVLFIQPKCMTQISLEIYVCILTKKYGSSKIP